jgi:hypothetical protein
MSFLRPLLLATALPLLAASGAAQTTPAPPDEPASPASSAFMLSGFVRDATTLTALPWQQEPLGLSTAQVTALRGIAEGYQPTVEELYGELRMLFENVALLDRPVDAHEAYALFFDIAAHKAEALATFHVAAEAMRAVLTPEQRARWEAELEAATWEQLPSEPPD